MNEHICQFSFRRMCLTVVHINLFFSSTTAQQATLQLGGPLGLKHSGAGCEPKHCEPCKSLTFKTAGEPPPVLPPPAGCPCRPALTMTMRAEQGRWQRNEMRGTWDFK